MSIERPFGGFGEFGGSAWEAFGGEGGVVLEVHTLDVVVIPAGVAHRNLGSSGDIRLVYEPSTH
jgi:uncharacterized protein YjlB